MARTRVIRRPARIVRGVAGVVVAAAVVVAVAGAAPRMPDPTRHRPDVTGPSWTPAFIGLGSNLDDPPRQLDAALAALAALPGTRLVACAPRYGSDPVGPQDQPRFLNTVAALVTTLGAEALHAELRALEQRLGKVPPVVRFGPRRIDLDLLVYGDAVISTAVLEVPHPRLHERAFVLYPLAEIAPDLWIPGRGRVARLKAALRGDGLTLQ
jgi:2-amino-4-hydroxy-6-hydroxymethyldihydropteridine diphosphokinase